MQRLFSTFADGWPGLGLLLIRLLAAAALIYFGILGLMESIPLDALILQVTGAAAGVLLLLGLWTPIAGSIAALAKMWVAYDCFSLHSGDPWITVVQAVLGAALAMIGPGAWSVDARLFGRKHIDLTGS